MGNTGIQSNLSFLPEMVYLPFPLLPVNFPHELFEVARTSSSRAAAQNRARNAERFVAVATDGSGAAASFELFASPARAIAEDAGPDSGSAADAGR